MDEVIGSSPSNFIKLIYLMATRQIQIHYNKGTIIGLFGLATVILLSKQ